MLSTLALTSLILTSSVRDEIIRDHVLFSVAGKFVQVRGAATPEELVGKVKYSHAKTVVLMIHGGLVSTASALETFTQLHDAMPKDAYPIYLSWESGPAFSMFPPEAPRHRPKPERRWSGGEHLRPPHPLGDAERRLEHNTRGFGKLIWTQTKRFISYGTNPNDPDAITTRFMKAFVPLWKERKLRVVLVGHSAGAIYISRIIENLATWRKEPNFPSVDAGVEVVFMAPACTYESIAYRRNAFRKYVKAFRMFALADDAERYDALLAVNAAPKAVRSWYDASLLYYISNNLEGQVDRPLLGMERFWRLANREPIVMPRDLSEWEVQAVRITDDVLKIKANSVWSRGRFGEAHAPSPGGPGWECSAARHMDFWVDPLMQRSLSYIATHPMPPLR
jgi:hypothetical protein